MSDTVYELPDTVQLDPEQAATLAVLNEIDRQAAATGAMVALDPAPLVRAVWDADPRGRVPRVPRWDDAVPRRSIGGGRPAGHEYPQPTVEAWVGSEGNVVGFTVTMRAPTGHTVEGAPQYADQHQQIWAPAGDAETWFLAGLAAVRRARELAVEQPPPFDVVTDDEDGDGADQAAAPEPRPIVVALPGTAYYAVQDSTFPAEHGAAWNRLTDGIQRARVGARGERWSLSGDLADWQCLRDYLAGYARNRDIATAMSRIDAELADQPGVIVRD